MSLQSKAALNWDPYLQSFQKLHYMGNKVYEKHTLQVFVDSIVCLSLTQEGSHQAQSNLKFLMVLKEPCQELSEAQPKDIPPLLPKIVNLIRMIWVNSEFYNTRERLTGILRKASSSDSI